MSGVDIHVFSESDAMNRAAADYWVEEAGAAIAERGAFHVVLAGGSTPRHLYELLAHGAYADCIDWSRTHVWFGDERAVPPDHADSNYRMARIALLDHVPIPAGNIHPITADPEDIETAAKDYEAAIRTVGPPAERDMPRFDLVLLGMGADGHTASLFPGTPILGERHALAAAVYVERLAAWRVSLTLPVFDAARAVLFLVAGADKAPAVARALTASPAERPPAGQVLPDGTLDWYLDGAAAAELPAEVRHARAGG